MHSIERAEWNVTSGEGRVCVRAAPFLEMACFPKLLANIRQWPGLAFCTARGGGASEIGHVFRVGSLVPDS